MNGAAVDEGYSADEASGEQPSDLALVRIPL
jgi:hypothetical protein